MRNLKELNPILDGYFATVNGEIISRKGRTLKQNYRNKQKGCSYFSIKVWCKKRGWAVSFYVHRLVAFQHCNLELDSLKELVVNHKDGNKQNNCASNLEWCTQAHNIKEFWRIKKLNSCTELCDRNG
jgi:hypothetical protein